MDVSTSCKGMTASRTRCTRTAHLNAQGYCFQHAGQNAVENSNMPAATTSGSHHEEPREEPREEQRGEQSDHQREQEPEITLLRRCGAVSTSRNQQCGHHVSFPEERYCPAHGGRQKAPRAPAYGQCQGVTKARQRCSKQVSVPGETFCPAHGGLTKGAVRVATATATRGTPGEGDAWPAMMAAVVNYVVVEHPAACQCGPSDHCHTMKMIQWMLSLMANQGAPNADQVATLTRDNDVATNPRAFWALNMYQLVASASRRPPADQPDSLSFFNDLPSFLRRPGDDQNDHSAL